MELIVGIVLGSALTATLAPPALIGGVQRLVRGTVRKLISSRRGGGPQ